MSKKILVPFKLLTLASDPLSGNEGEVYFNTTDKSIRIHNGEFWITIVKSDDPTPFYQHTHTYDGDVHTIDLQNKIDFKTLSGGSVIQDLPVIIGVDGGNPNSAIDPSSFSVLDDGEINGNWFPRKFRQLYKPRFK